MRMSRVCKAFPIPKTLSQQFHIVSVTDTWPEWEASEGEYGSSEPMESINDLSLPVDSDLNDTEVQL